MRGPRASASLAFRPRGVWSIRGPVACAGRPLVYPTLWSIRGPVAYLGAAVAGRFGLYGDLSPCSAFRWPPPSPDMYTKVRGWSVKRVPPPPFARGCGRWGQGRGAAQGCVAHARCWELQVDSSRRVALGTGLTASDLEFGACWLVASLGGFDARLCGRGKYCDKITRQDLVMPHASPLSLQVRKFRPMREKFTVYDRCLPAGWRLHRQKDVKRVGADLCRPPEVLERLLSSEQIVGESWRFPSVLQVISRIGLCPRRTSAKWTRTRPASRRVILVLRIPSRAAAAPTSRRTRSAGRLKD